MVCGVLFIERVQKSLLPRSYEKFDPGKTLRKNWAETSIINFGLFSFQVLTPSKTENLH